MVSEAAHCRFKKDDLLTKESAHWVQFEEIIDWSARLNVSDNEKKLNIVRRNINKNLPCDSDAFLMG